MDSVIDKSAFMFCPVTHSQNALPASERINGTPNILIRLFQNKAVLSFCSVPVLVALRRAVNSLLTISLRLSSFAFLAVDGDGFDVASDESVVGSSDDGFHILSCLLV
jgi:hypothetical protein